MITCEKCGKPINSLLVNTFDREGNDYNVKVPISSTENNSVVLETNRNWTGYELDAEELPETICCPHCRQFPFIDDEVQVYEVVRIVCFKQNR